MRSTTAARPVRRRRRFGVRPAVLACRRPSGPRRGPRRRRPRRRCGPRPRPIAGMTVDACGAAEAGGRRAGSIARRGWRQWSWAWPPRPARLAAAADPPAGCRGRRRPSCPACCCWLLSRNPCTWLSSCATAVCAKAVCGGGRGRKPSISSSRARAVVRLGGLRRKACVHEVRGDLADALVGEQRLLHLGELAALHAPPGRSSSPTGRSRRRRACAGHARGDVAEELLDLLLVVGAFAVAVRGVSWLASMDTAM